MPEIPDWLRLWYRRPQWRDIQDYTRQLNDKDIRPTRSPSPAAGQPTSIPSRLALDRVLANKTCSPMSLHDFYLYLQHIEHSSENLEFYLWYKSYEASAPKSVRDKTAGGAEKDEPSHLGYVDARSELETPGASSVSEILTAKNSLSSLSDSILKAEPPCARLARAETKWTGRIFPWWPATRPTTGTAEQQLIDGPAPCVRLGTCPIDPNDVEKGPAVPLPVATGLSPQAESRGELDAAIETYLLPGAEKELNISHNLRQRTLNSLQMSGDPAHLKPVADHIYEVMKNCSHRNFVAMGVSTGTYETICVGNLLGISCILAGFLLVLLRGLYPHIGAHSRWEVFCSFPLWTMGVTFMLVGTQGMCFLMLSLSKRQALPWERFEENNSVKTHTTTASGAKRWWRRYRAFMNRTVAHDRNFKVEDKHLRRLQRLILCQCFAWAAGAAFCGVLLFIFLPIWKETV